MFRRASIFTLALLLLGCLPYSPVSNPKPPVEMPEKFNHKKVAKNAGNRWWLSFKDEQLTRLIETALTTNFDVMTAWARLEQAQAQATAAGAPLWPSLSLAAGVSVAPLPNFIREQATRARREFEQTVLNDDQLSTAQKNQLLGATDPDNFNETLESNPNLSEQEKQVLRGSGPNLVYPPDFLQENYNLGLNIRYELDLFGKRLTESEVAGMTAVNARDVVESTAILTSAQVATAYLNHLHATLLLQLLNEQLENNQSYYELMKLRFEKGLSSALDVYQQEDRVRSTEQQVKSAELQQQTALLTVSQLLGESPGKLNVQAKDTLPEPPPFPAMGVPADLLRNRPDVRAARRSVEIADRRVGIAIAAYFPTITLSGQLLYNATSLDTLFDSLLWGIGGDLSQVIFDGFGREANVDLQEATVRESLMQYGKTVVDAIIEVETAIMTERNQVELVELIDKQLESSERTLREARARYERGLTDFLPVLTAQTALQSAQIASLQARHQLLVNRITLHRAIGGTWTRKLVQPTWVEPQDGEDPEVPPIEDKEASE